MACTITFDNNATTGILSGSNWSTDGIFDLVGYSPTENGTYGVGGNWPWDTNVWGAQVDPSNIEEGFYKFKYHADLSETDPCYAELEFIVPIIQGTGEFDDSVKEIQLCSQDGIRNIFNDSEIYDKSSILSVEATISNDDNSPGYSDNGTTNDITDDTYDPSQETSYPSTVEFTITYTPTSPTGYTKKSCNDCNQKQKIIRYIVTETFVVGTSKNESVCNDGQT